MEGWGDAEADLMAYEILKIRAMPYFMDLHIVPGATAEAVARAHREDLKAQENFECNCMTYWVDVDRGRAFCLIEAPNKEAINKLHQKTLGVKPLEIIEVNPEAVQSFLGRVRDPEITQRFKDAESTDLKIFNDPAFRVVMVTQILNDRLLQLTLGDKKTKRLQKEYKKRVKKLIIEHEGGEIKGEQFLASFNSVFQAVQCALEIQKKLTDIGAALNLKISLHAGMPVAQNQVFFGDVVKMGRYLCFICKENQILISPIVRELYKKEYEKIADSTNLIRPISTSEETFLELLMTTLFNNWRNSIFGIDDFCLIMAMSKSELYRKSKTITGMSINTLLREYRLQKSLELLGTNINISQTAFDTGFSSASYFTKCFHKRFGMQPTTFANNQ